jgi:GTP-binding protein
MANQKPETRFIISANNPAQFPNLRLPEFAFLGRSNVGKSSLLNALAGTKGLAHTSAQPGRTQAINFFSIGDRVTFADLPGYGFAKVPLTVKNQWKDLIEAYLHGREQLRLCFLLLDARRGWMESDEQLRDWLEHRGRAYQVVATKTDKLKKSELQRALAAIREGSGELDLAPFSAATGQGAREIWHTIKNYTTR